MRHYIAVLLTLMTLSACSSEPYAPTDEQLPAILIDHDNRCTLIEKDRQRLDVSCTVEPAGVPLVVRIDASPCGSYTFIRGAYAPAICEVGCTPAAASRPDCPLRHSTSASLAWTMLDRR